MGVFLYPIYKENTTMFYHSSLTTFAIVISLTAITYMKPDIIKNSWFMPLFLITVGLLIASLGESFLASRGMKYKTQTRKMISYATIGIFSLWMLYDTKQIIRNAENCINPDYINQSMNILLDTLNIFTGVRSVQN
jgi:FtsH-binding integral membrane protein